MHPGRQLAVLGLVFVVLYLLVFFGAGAKGSFSNRLHPQLGLDLVGGTQATYLEVKPIMLNAASKDKGDAWAVIKTLGSKEFVATDNKLEGVNPPRKDVADLPEFKNDWWQSK